MHTIELLLNLKNDMKVSRKPGRVQGGMLEAPRDAGGASCFYCVLVQATDYHHQSFWFPYSYVLKSALHEVKVANVLGGDVWKSESQAVLWL